MKRSHHQFWNIESLKVKERASPDSKNNFWVDIIVTCSDGGEDTYTYYSTKKITIEQED